MNKEQIVQLIAMYLERKEVPFRKWDDSWGNEQAKWPLPVEKIAEEIATIVQPLINKSSQDFAGWIAGQIIQGRTYHKLWLDYLEEKQIASLVTLEDINWKDAPEWANWRTIDGGKHLTFWEFKPVLIGGWWKCSDQGGQHQSMLINDKPIIEKRPK